MLSPTLYPPPPEILQPTHPKPSPPRTTLALFVLPLINRLCTRYLCIPLHLQLIETTLTPTPVNATNRRGRFWARSRTCSRCDARLPSAGTSTDSSMTCCELPVAWLILCDDTFVRHHITITTGLSALESSCPADVAWFFSPVSVFDR